MPSRNSISFSEVAALAEWMEEVRDRMENWSHRLKAAEQFTEPGRTDPRELRTQIVFFRRGLTIESYGEYWCEPPKIDLEF